MSVAEVGNFQAGEEHRHHPALTFGILPPTDLVWAHRSSTAAVKKHCYCGDSLRGGATDDRFALGG